MLHLTPIPEDTPPPEPFYVAQTAEAEHLQSALTARRWFADQLDNAVKQRGPGACWPRFTVDGGGGDASALLIEVWDYMPTEEGLPRWALQRAG